MELQYITQDFKNMGHAECDAAKVRCGNLDFERLYHYLYNTDTAIAQVNCHKLKWACLDAARNRRFTRRHIDLLHLEFGENEVTAAEVTLLKDILESPADSNVQKLNEVLDFLREKIQTY